MKILRATFLSIRGLGDLTANFADSVTGRAQNLIVVAGQPASGKTRLLEALITAKEVIAPYGALVQGAPWIAHGVDSAKVHLVFQLTEHERRAAGAASEYVEAEALFTQSVSRREADVGLVSLLERYEHDRRCAKLEYFPANRGIAALGAAHGLHPVEQRLVRATREPRKYSCIPRFLQAIADSEAARARFAATLEGLSSNVRYLGTGASRDPLRSLSSRGGPPVTATELSSSEGDAVIFAATACFIELSQSMIFIDRPELSTDERGLSAWLQGLAALGEDNQIFLATGAAWLTSAVDPKSVVTLGA